MTQKRGYGQFCPVAKASEIPAERWTPPVVRELLHGSHRFNDLRRGVPLMFEFPEQPANKRCWWLLKDREELDLCLQDPGYDVDPTVSADLRTMTRIWLGDLGIAEAMRMRTLRLAGSAALRPSFHDWIGLSPFVQMQEPSLPSGA